MVAALLLLLVCGDTSYQRSDVITDTVDMIEINHFYDEHGRIVFDQLIYWNWVPHDSSFRVVTWRLLKDCREKLTEEEKRRRQKLQPILETRPVLIRMPVVPEFLWTSPMIPTRQPNGMYRATWYDGDVLRSVSCFHLRETWTQFDPELADREFLPKEQRRGLSKPTREK